MGWIVRAGVALVVLLGAGASWWVKKPAREAEPVQTSAPVKVPTTTAAVAAAANPNSRARPQAMASAPVGWQAPQPGSEGYGAHIQRALDGGDPRLALWAAQQIQSCATVSARADHHQAARAQLDKAHAGLAAKVITATEAEARRCQTVTPDLQGQAQQLARRAAQAGVVGAATVFSQTLHGARDAALDSEAQAYLREAALRADGNAVRTLAESVPRAFATDVERQAYAWAFEQRWGKGFSEDPSLLSPLPVFFEALVPNMPPNWKPRLDAAQQVQARQLADALIARWSSLPPPQRRGG